MFLLIYLYYDCYLCSSRIAALRSINLLREVLLIDSLVSYILLVFLVCSLYLYMVNSILVSFLLDLLIIVSIYYRGPLNVTF